MVTFIIFVTGKKIICVKETDVVDYDVVWFWFRQFKYGNEALMMYEDHELNIFGIENI